jgi:hypothetical protein
LVLLVVAAPELISAVCRLQREDRSTGPQYQEIKRAFLSDIADALLCDTPPGVIQHAVSATAWMPMVDPLVKADSITKCNAVE